MLYMGLDMVVDGLDMVEDGADQVDGPTGDGVGVIGAPGPPLALEGAGEDLALVLGVPITKVNAQHLSFRKLVFPRAK
jgi:hypothetical protein